jgi:hypothetical protein
VREAVWCVERRDTPFSCPSGWHRIDSGPDPDEDLWCAPNAPPAAQCPDGLVWVDNISAQCYDPGAAQSGIKCTYCRVGCEEPGAGYKPPPKFGGKAAQLKKSEGMHSAVPDLELEDTDVGTTVYGKAKPTSRNRPTAPTALKPEQIDVDSTERSKAKPVIKKRSSAPAAMGGKAAVGMVTIPAAKRVKLEDVHVDPTGSRSARSAGPGKVSASAARGAKLVPKNQLTLKLSVDPGNPKVNSSVDVTARLKNLGTKDTKSGEYLLKFSCEKEPSKGACERLVDKVGLPAVAAGQEKNNTAKHVFRVKSFGGYTVKACTYLKAYPAASPWCNSASFSVKPPRVIQNENVQETPIPQPGPQEDAGESMKMKKSLPAVRTR